MHSQSLSSIGTSSWHLTPIAWTSPCTICLLSSPLACRRAYGRRGALCWRPPQSLCTSLLALPLLLPAAPMLCIKGLLEHILMMWGLLRAGRHLAALAHCHGGSIKVGGPHHRTRPYSSRQLLRQHDCNGYDGTWHGRRGRPLRPHAAGQEWQPSHGAAAARRAHHDPLWWHVRSCRSWRNLVCFAEAVPHCAILCLTCRSACCIERFRPSLLLRLE